MNELFQEQVESKKKYLISVSYNKEACLILNKQKDFISHSIFHCLYLSKSGLI